jgi:hypothetical protein
VGKQRDLQLATCTDQKPIIPKEEHMDISLTRSDSVYSKDGEMLGSPLFIAHRLDGDEVNPELDLLRGPCTHHIPQPGDQFPCSRRILRQPRDNGNVMLSLTQHQILNYWMRLPDFVARGNFRREDLPES